jgi:hypothetical protein
MDEVPDRKVDIRPDGRRDARVTTTATLGVMLLCVLMANKISTGATPHAAQQQDAASVRIVDPAFCQNQTWPYLDARCLKRVDDRKPTARESTSADSATMRGTTVATSVQQPDPSIQTSPATREASPTDQPANAQTPAAANMPAQTRSDPPAAEVSPAPAKPANNSYGSQSVIGDTGSPSTGPMAAPNTFSDGTVVDPTSLHRQHHYHRHRFLFGFRF